MKREGVPGFGHIISQTFFTITTLIDLGNTEIKFILVSNYSVCFSYLENLLHEAGINVVSTFYTKIH